MKKFCLIVLFIVLSCTFVYADDIVELDSDGHINLVDRVKETKEKFFPDTVQSGPTDSELLNQIIESSVSKFVSVSTGGWSDVLSDVYDLIGITGTVIDSATTVTQQAIDKINDWFDLSDDGFIRTSPSWRTDMSHIYNLKGFDTVEGGLIGNWVKMPRTLYGKLGSVWVDVTFTSSDDVWLCIYGSPGSYSCLQASKNSSAKFTYSYFYRSQQNIQTSLYNDFNGIGRYNAIMGPITDTQGLTPYSDSYSALTDFFGNEPSVGGTFYNHSMYMNTSDSYNPDIFIRSLPATNWQNVSSNRYNLVGSDPTPDSINNTFNSSNPVYNNVNYNYKFDDVYNNRDYPVYEFDSDNVYSVPDIELSTDFDKSNLFYDIGNSATDSEGGSFYVTLFGIIATFLILGVIL